MNQYLHLFAVPFLFFICSIPGKAQVAGPEVGLSVSALNYVGEDFTAGISAHGGGTAHLKLGRFFAIRPSLLLKFSYFQNFDILDKKTTTLTRVSVPVAFMYTKAFKNGNQFCAGAGPQLMYSLAGKSDYNDEYIKRKIKFGNGLNDDLKPLDLGLHFKGGFIFDSGLALNFFFSTGLTNINPRNQGYKIKSLDIFGCSLAWLFGNDAD